MKTQNLRINLNFLTVLPASMKCLTIGLSVQDESEEESSGSCARNCFPQPPRRGM